MAQTLTEIKQLLAAHGLRPKHKFGQNFLHDGNHMRRIMDAAAIGPGDVVLEVGPGTGALTERLLETGAEVVASEIDTDLEPVLRDRLGGADGRFILVMGDILAGKRVLNPDVVDWLNRPDHGEDVAASGGRPFKLIANLPYNIASPLLANLALDHPGMSDAVVMIQKEVADRLTAKPGGKDYGPLGILIQAVCEVSTVGVLPPSCFWPAPKVASAVVHLKRRQQPLAADPHGFSELLQTLFTKRRKQLGSILGRDTSLPDGIDANARPESLSLEQLVALQQHLQRGDASP